MAVQRLSYTYADASEATGLSQTVLKEAVREGELRTLKPKGKAGKPISRVLFDPAELERWLHNK